MFEAARAYAADPSEDAFGGADEDVVVSIGRRDGPAVERLRAHGLRPTRQRLDLVGVLFSQGDRHVSAEQVYSEALAAGAKVSLATVYNTLKQFTEAGLLVELAAAGAKSFFDTRVDSHHHFYVEDEGVMMDVSADDVGIDRLPTPPEGMEIVGCEVTIRLRRKR